MIINLQKYLFCFAEEVLNSKFALKKEIEDILLNPKIDIPSLSRAHFNQILKELSIKKV
jgi:hypothetical protein